MYSKLMLLFSLILLLGCRKSEEDGPAFQTKETKLIASKSDAFDKVQSYLLQKSSSEQLLQIDQVSFIHADDRLLAIVFYTSNTGVHNLLIEQQIDTQEKVMAEKVTFCRGDDCTCKVTAVIDNQGNVNVDCTCSSCIMITTEN